MMGGALGLAILASVAASRTSDLLATGESNAAALTGGYHVAFLIGALFASAPRRSAASSFECAGDGARRRRGGYRGGLTLREPLAADERARLSAPAAGWAALEMGPSPIPRVRVLTASSSSTYWSRAELVAADLRLTESRPRAA